MSEWVGPNDCPGCGCRVCGERLHDVENDFVDIPTLREQNLHLIDRMDRLESELKMFVNSRRLPFPKAWSENE